MGEGKGTRRSKDFIPQTDKTWTTVDVGGCRIVLCLDYSDCRNLLVIK